jgi:hypothetical protein
MRQGTIFFQALSLSLIFFCGCAVRGNQFGLPEPQAQFNMPSPIKETPESSDIPAGWKLYTDPEYGFSFSTPAGYSILTDKENLSGWDNAILLIYNDGQTYDIAVQVWDTREELEKYFSNRIAHVTLFEKSGKLLSVFDVSSEADNTQIIATFRMNRK